MMNIKVSQKVKIAQVESLSQQAQSAVSVTVAEYRGLSSSDLTSLRQQARQKGVYVKVLKNTLARLVVKETDHERVTEDLKGPVILAFAGVDAPSSAAKLLNDFAKKNELLVIKSVSLSGKRLDASQIEVVANLPTYDQAIAMLMSCMQAPTRKLATACQETYGRLARVLNAYAEKNSA